MYILTNYTRYLYHNTPPQLDEMEDGFGTKRVNINMQLRMDWNGLGWRGFIKISSCWFALATCMSLMNPFLTWSLTVWQSISTCLALSWKTGLVAMCIANLLSQKSLAHVCTLIWRLVRRCWRQSNSHVAWAILLYSAYVLLRLTTSCFLTSKWWESFLDKHNIQI